MENATEDFKEITDVGLCFCSCDALVEYPTGPGLGPGLSEVKRKWACFFRKGKPRTCKVNVAQIAWSRRFTVKLGRTETRKNPFRRGWRSLFEPKAAQFFVDEGVLDVIEVKTADGTTFDADASAAPEWLKAIAPVASEERGLR